MIRHLLGACRCNCAPALRCTICAYTDTIRSFEGAVLTASVVCFWMHARAFAASRPIAEQAVISTRLALENGLFNIDGPCVISSCMSHSDLSMHNSNRATRIRGKPPFWRDCASRAAHLWHSMLQIVAADVQDCYPGTTSAAHWAISPLSQLHISVKLTGRFYRGGDVG